MENEQNPADLPPTMATPHQTSHRTFRIGVDLLRNTLMVVFWIVVVTAIILAACFGYSLLMSVIG